jgi:hypothetical protein
MRGGKRNAFADLADRPVDQLDGALTMTALIGDRRFQLTTRVLQKRKRSLNARLSAEGVSNSQARNDENSDEQFLARCKTKHGVLPKLLSPTPIYGIGN